MLIIFEIRLMETLQIPGDVETQSTRYVFVLIDNHLVIICRMMTKEHDLDLAAAVIMFISYIY